MAKLENASVLSSVTATTGIWNYTHLLCPALHELFTTFVCGKLVMPTNLAVKLGEDIPGIPVERVVAAETHGPPHKHCSCHNGKKTMSFCFHLCYVCFLCFHQAKDKALNLKTGESLGLAI